MCTGTYFHDLNVLPKKESKLEFPEYGNDVYNFVKFPMIFLIFKNIFQKLT